MDADFGIPPSEERQEEFVKEIDRILDCSDFSSSFPAAAYPPAANHFPAAGGASGHVPSLGGPDLFGGLEDGDFTGLGLGLGFNAAQNLPTHGALPALSVSPSSSVDSPSPLTPPDVYGGSTAWVDPASLPNVTARPLAIDPRLLNATAGSSSAATIPSPSFQGLPTARSNEFACRFGEDTAEKHLFGFRYALPRDHPNYHRPSNPKPSGSCPTFMLPEAQCPPPLPQAAQPEFLPPLSQEFAQGSSSDVYYPTDWLSGAPQLAGMPLHQQAFLNATTSLPSVTFLNDPTSLLPASLPNAQSAFADGGYGYAPIADAFGGMLPPQDHVVHGDGGHELMGASESAPSSSLGKRKAAPTYPASSTRKAAKASSGSRPSQKAPRKPHKARPDPDFRPESKITHKYELCWTESPPKWGKDDITISPASFEKSSTWFARLREEYGSGWAADSFTCRFNGCGKVCGKYETLRSHVTSKAHMDIRRECLRCGWDVCEDMFKSRHDRKMCDKKHAEKTNPDAGKKRKPRAGGGRKKGGDA